MCCCSTGRHCSAPRWRGNTSCSIPCSTPKNKHGKSLTHLNERTTTNGLPEVKETHGSRSTVALLSHFYKSVTAFCRLEQLPEEEWQSVKDEAERCVIRDSCDVQRRGAESNLGGPVKQTRAATFQKELLVVCDAAFGESPWVLNPEEREKG